MKKLIERLDFHDSQLYLDEKEILRSPGNGSNGEIDIVTTTFINNKQIIYVGTGGCCHGYLLELKKDYDKNFTLNEIFAVNFNVFEILPLILRSELGSGSSNEHAVLVAGSGCAGSGLGLVNLYQVRYLDVITREQYKFALGLKFKHPRLSGDYESSKVNFELYDIRTRLLPGRIRDPKVPNCLVTSAEEFYISDYASYKLDITQKLEELGVDILKTLELTKKCEKIIRKVQ